MVGKSYDKEEDVDRNAHWYKWFSELGKKESVGEETRTALETGTTEDDGTTTDKTPTTNLDKDLLFTFVDEIGYSNCFDLSL